MHNIPSKQVIFFLPNYGSSIRNVVAGGVIRRLLQRYVVVFLGVSQEDQIDIRSRIEGDFVFEEIGETPYRGPIRWLQRVRTYVWRSKVNYSELLSSEGKQDGLRDWIHQAIGRLLRPVPRVLWARLNAKLARWPAGHQLVARYKPVAAIISNPISDDNCVVEFCRNRHILTVCVLESWDNLTNRGALYSLPDHMIVWNQLIAAQAIKYHQFDPQQVSVTGIPSFDLYAHPETYPSEDEWRNDNGLPPSGPVLTYSLSMKLIHGNEDAIIRRIVAARDQGLLPPDLSILVRLHPKDYQDVKGRYEAIDKVVLQRPNLGFAYRVNDNTTSGSGPMMLAATLRYSAVVVNVFSTLCVEALCNDTPVVVINFDLEDRPMVRSVKRYQRFEHIKELLSFEAVDVANSPKELISLIDQNLKDPDRRLEQRRRCVAAEAFGLDGRASERTADHLMRLLELRGQQHVC